MLRMPFMLLNKYFLCSGCHFCFEINIFYVLDATYALNKTFSMFRIAKITFLVKNNYENIKTGH